VETERLMGWPDGWTIVKSWPRSSRRRSKLTSPNEALTRKELRAGTSSHPCGIDCIDPSHDAEYDEIELEMIHSSPSDSTPTATDAAATASSRRSASGSGTGSVAPSMRERR
jgi:hypothetical protein